MTIKTATILTAISTDTGTPGDFITTDPTLVFSGTFSHDIGQGDNLHVFVNGKAVGVATLDLTHGTWTFDYTGTELAPGDYTIALGTSDQASSILDGSSHGIEIDAICYMAGTLIRTPTGEKAVEELQPGDLVSTADGRDMPVSWLGRQTIAMAFANKARVLPVCIRAGALAENVPSRDLRVSPGHAVFVDGNLIQASALVNGSSIIRINNVPSVFTYYHVEVDEHALIFAENTPAETFVDNVDRLAFDNWAEHEALYPDGKQLIELPYPRAKSHRQVPRNTRALLQERAVAIGAVDSAVA